MAVLSITYTFSNGTTIDAGEMNTNFQDVVDSLTDGTKSVTLDAATFGGTVTCNGNVTLGNGSGDDVTITGSLAATLNIKTDGSFDLGSTTKGLRLAYFGDAGGNTVGIQAPAIASNYTFTLPGFTSVMPASDGSANSILITNGSGTFSFSFKKNIAGTTAPTTTDDTGSSYTVGSVWCDTTNDRSYMCVDATSSAAKWVMLDSHYPMKNVILNSGMNIWNDGTSFAAISSGTYHAEMYSVAFSGTMVNTVTQDTDVPSSLSETINYSTKIDNTTADASIDAGDYFINRYFVEGYDFAANLADSPFLLNFWVKSTKTGTFCVGFVNSGNDRSYVVEYTVNSSDTWEEKTVYVTTPPSAGTWDYTTGSGLKIYWTLACGSTYQTTADAWQTGNYFATSNQVNAMDSTSNNFFLAAPQIMAVPSVAVPAPTYRPAYPILNEELAATQRYYEKSYNFGTDPGTSTTTGRIFFFSNNHTSAARAVSIPTRFHVEKRTTPTMTIYTNAGTSGKVDMNSGEIAVTLNDTGTKGFRAGGTESGATTTINTGYHYVANARL